MSRVPPRIHHETLYDLVKREQWSELLDLLYSSRAAVRGDVLLEHALTTFGSVFFDRLDEDDAEMHADDIEKLFLLHAGGFHELTSEQFERLVVHLVHLNSHDPAAAAGYARHYPSNPVCIDALSRYNVREPVDGVLSKDLRLDRTQPRSGKGATVPLFKSRQEAIFFLAAQEVFPQNLVYPNVALRTVIDYDAVRSELSARERRFFFVGVLDCVIFESENFRPLYFFEVDSPLHDDAAQRENDGHKDRIVSTAGARLYRIRTSNAAATRGDLVKLLRAVIS